LNRCGRNCLPTFKGKKKMDMPKRDQEDIKFVRFLANLLHSGRMRDKWIRGQSKEKFALQMVRQEKHFCRRGRQRAINEARLALRPPRNV